MNRAYASPVAEPDHLADPQVDHADARRRRSVSLVSLMNHPGYNAGMKGETISPRTPAELNPSLFDLGHQGDVDRTQIAQHLRLTPTERLRHHESWRLFVKEAVRRAEFSRTSRQRPEQQQG
jgi:hypothetical protein